MLFYNIKHFLARPRDEVQKDVLESLKGYFVRPVEGCILVLLESNS